MIIIHIDQLYKIIVNILIVLAHIFLISRYRTTKKLIMIYYIDNKKHSFDIYANRILVVFNQMISSF